MKDLNRLHVHKLTVYYGLSILHPSEHSRWLVTRASVRTLSHPPVLTRTEKSEPKISTSQESSVASQRTFIRAAVSRLFKPRFTYTVGMLKGRGDKRTATPPKKFLQGHVTTWVRLSSQPWIPYQVKWSITSWGSTLLRVEMDSVLSIIYLWPQKEGASMMRAEADMAMEPIVPAIQDIWTVICRTG